VVNIFRLRAKASGLESGGRGNGKVKKLELLVKSPFRTEKSEKSGEEGGGGAPGMRNALGDREGC